MKLEFESLNELRRFCEDTGLLGQKVQVLVKPEVVTAEPDPAPEPAPAKPKRKRRTKAEIEADRKAAAAEAEPAEEQVEMPIEPEPEPEVVEGEVVDMVDEADVKQRFRLLVNKDTDAAIELLESLDCQTFDEVREAGKVAQLSALL